MAAYGLAALAGCQVSFFNAIQHLPAGMALLLEYLAPVLVAGWLWARHGQRSRRMTVAGSALALLGHRPALTQLAGGSLLLAGVAAVHADTPVPDCHPPSLAISPALPTGAPRPAARS